VIGDQPVMWVNAKTLNPAAPTPSQTCSAGTRRCFNACSQYQNMRVYDWGVSRQGQVVHPDGIHYYSPDTRRGRT